MKQIKFKGQRIDTQEWVSGYYFKSPLTDENSGTDSECGWFFLTGETRHCISSEHGVVFVVIPETVMVDESYLEDNGTPLEEHISTVYSKIIKAKDDALAVQELHKMVDTILGLKSNG